jgi:hypothetical protein
MFVAKIFLGICAVFGHLGMVLYRTLNMAKSAERASRPFLDFALKIYVILCMNTLWQTGHTLLCGSLRRMLFLLACMVVKYGVLCFAGRQGVL